VITFETSARINRPIEEVSLRVGPAQPSALELGRSGCAEGLSR